MSATIASLERRFANLKRGRLFNRRTVNLNPVDMARAALNGKNLDTWQEEFLLAEEQDILVNCSRQAGKSFCAAVKGMHAAFREENATVLVLSPSLRQSGELFRKCMQIYNSLGRPIPPLAESTLRLELVNGSRVISLPGKEETIRGISAVTMLLLDEASRIADELFTAVSPMLAVSNGRRLLLSTPWGARGKFYQACQDKESWRYFEVPATSIPRISPAFLERERREMGDWLFEQEYLCKFGQLRTAAFRLEDIEAMIKPGVEQWIL